MRVVWDPRKARTNFLRHGVRFSDAEGALYDPFALTREDPSSEGEARFVTIGADYSGQIVVVVYAHRADTLRILSARRSTRRERLTYEEGVRL